MEPFTAGDLAIEVEEAPDAVRLIWRGKSNARNPTQVLAPLFARVRDLAEERKTPLTLRFDTLEFFNSATIAAIIQLVHECRARSVKLVVIFDPKVKWQKLSFESLRILARPDGLLELSPIA